MRLFTRDVEPDEFNVAMCVVHCKPVQEALQRAQHNRRELGPGRFGIAVLASGRPAFYGQIGELQFVLMPCCKPEFKRVWDDVQWLH